MPFDVKKALANWATLQLAVRHANEKELKSMLDSERAGQRRVQFLLRIYGRYNRVRGERERRELIGA